LWRGWQQATEGERAREGCSSVNRFVVPRLIGATSEIRGEDRMNAVTTNGGEDRMNAVTTNRRGER
jgi:hypothetical protein